MTPFTIIALLGAGVVVGAVVTLISVNNSRERAAVYHRLTYARGNITAARFDEDGSIVYAAAWDGGPTRIYRTQPSGASAALDLPPAQLLSITRSGQLAISLRPAVNREPLTGTLAEVPRTGGRTSRLAEDVRDAAWADDGETVAIVRRVNGRDQLEWPTGKVLYSTTGYVSNLRFSPDGTRLAFVSHPIIGRDAGDLLSVDQAGNRSVLLANLPDVRGVAWTPDGEELWFAAASDDPQGFATLQAVNTSGRRRTVLSAGFDLSLMDIDPTGRVLVAGETRLTHVEALLPGDPVVHDYSSIDTFAANGISNAGDLLMTRRRTPGVLMKRIDRNDDVVLGDGEGFDLSADGTTAVSISPDVPSRVRLFRPRTLETTELGNPAGLVLMAAKLLPAEKGAVMLGSRPGEPLRGYIQTFSDGVITRFTRPGVSLLPLQNMVVTPDGNAVGLRDPGGNIRLFPVAGGEPQAFQNLADGEYPLSWGESPNDLFVTRSSAPPWRIERLDLASGQRTLWKEVAPLQNVGVTRSRITISPDGNALVHTYLQVLSNLFVVDGLN